MNLRVPGRLLLSLFFVGAGLNHFRDPALYQSMMPPWVPWPELLQKVAGAAEVAGGLGILIPRFRRMAGWGLLLLLVAVFPANLHLALHGWPEAPGGIAPWVLWARLPLQLVFALWVWWAALSESRPQESRGAPLS
jgi:uncharacterized membrane protein